MRLIRLPLLVVAAALLLVAGCGDDDSSDTEESTTTTEATSTTADPSGSKSAPPPPPVDDDGTSTTLAADEATPGAPCELGSDPDCIDPDGNGQGVYLIDGGDCMVELASAPELCQDLDGDGVAGYPDSG